jgi:hypothetical protein
MEDVLNLKPCNSHTILIWMPVNAGQKFYQYWKFEFPLQPKSWIPCRFDVKLREKYSLLLLIIFIHPLEHSVTICWYFEFTLCLCWYPECNPRIKDNVSSGKFHTLTYLDPFLHPYFHGPYFHVLDFVVHAFMPMQSCLYTCDWWPENSLIYFIREWNFSSDDGRLKGKFQEVVFLY